MGVDGAAAASSVEVDVDVDVDVANDASINARKCFSSVLVHFLTPLDGVTVVVVVVDVAAFETVGVAVTSLKRLFLRTRVWVAI